MKIKDNMSELHKCAMVLGLNVFEWLFRVDYFNVKNYEKHFVSVIHSKCPGSSATTAGPQTPGRPFFLSLSFTSRLED